MNRKKIKFILNIRTLFIIIVIFTVVFSMILFVWTNDIFWIKLICSVALLLLLDIIIIICFKKKLEDYFENEV